MNEGTRTAVLYARVSTDEQARSGYSLRQQIEALRAWCASEGFKVLEEAEDSGYSGAFLERPGLDQVRDLVAAGAVSVVVAQDRDRFAREPAYLHLLRQEFERHGTKMRALNDRGDESPEGELTDGILDQLAKFERAKTAERTRRGLDRKAKEGKLIRGNKAPIGFRYSEDGEALIAHEPEMRVVRRIFRMVGGEGASLGEVERTLNREGVPSPTGGRWHRPSVRNVVLSDLYRPHTFEEVAPLVSPQVAASLDREGLFGFWYWNRTRQRRWKERGVDGAIRNRVENIDRPREEWVVVPVSLVDAGLSRPLADAAGEVLAENLRRRTPSTAARRFWQLSGGIARCDVCGNGFSPHTVNQQGKIRTYYRCFTRFNSGLDACSNGRYMQAPALEWAVWNAVYRLISDPHRLLRQYREHVEHQKRQVRGDPDREARDLAARLEKLERRRSGYLDLAADGDMSREDLRAKLTRLDGERAGFERALREAHARAEQLRKPEINYAHLDSLLLQMNRINLGTAAPEDRRRLYGALRLEAHVDEDRRVRLTGVFDPDVYLPGLVQELPGLVQEWPAGLVPIPGLASIPNTKSTVVTSYSSRPSIS